MLGQAASLAELKLLPVLRRQVSRRSVGHRGVAGGKQEPMAEGEGKEPVITLILSCQLVFSCGIVL